MIYTSLKEAEKLQWPVPFEKALDFLRRPDLAELPVGKYEIDGGDVFALVQLQKSACPAEKKAESHYTFIDIQYMIRGEESQGYAIMQENLEVEEHPERDVMYYPQVPGEKFVHLQDGEFTVYFTSDIHRPNCTDGDSRENKKVVVKIREGLIGK